MKDLELTARLRNNRLKERRTDLRMSQVALSKAAGVSVGVYRDLESMRASPIDHAGEWSATAKLLAVFHGVSEDELFPPSVLAVKSSVAVVKIDAADVARLLSDHQSAALAGPLEHVARGELEAVVRSAVRELPPRYAKVVGMRFGMDDGVERTVDEIGARLDVSRSRVHQMLASATRKLRLHVAKALTAPHTQKEDL